MTMFELLTQTALADTDLLRKNDKMGDIFAIAREVDLHSRPEIDNGQTTSPDS